MFTLISNWKDWWRMWSIRLSVLGTAVLIFFEGFPDVAFSVWASIPTILNLFSRSNLPNTSDTDSSPRPGSHAPSGNSSSSNEAESTPPKRWLAWAGHNNVTREFCLKVIDISIRLGVNPDHLMACMAFETGPKMRFLPSARNMAGSSGTGLIQFMSSTAKGLGTTTSALAAMSALEQLDWVEKYFEPYKGRMKTLEDLYMAILWPAAVGKEPGYVLFRKGTLAYTQNAGLDANSNGLITKQEAAAKVRETLNMGQRPPFYAQV